MSSQVTKESKEDLRVKQIQGVFNQLLKSPKGLTTIEVASKISIKDHREVRALIREALREAKKRKFIISKERMPGKATKIYNITSPEAQKASSMTSKA